jgi:hypothetical protein
MKTILKKLNKFRVILTVVVISLFLSSICIFNGCQKFQDGPKISFRSETERIANTWKFQKFIVNGKDSTASVSKWSMVLTKDHHVSIYSADTFGGTWELKRDLVTKNVPYTYKTIKDSMEIVVYNSNINNGIDPMTGNALYFSYDCKILELKQNNMHIQGKYTAKYPNFDYPYDTITLQNDTIPTDTTIAGTFDWTLVKK